MMLSPMLSPMLSLHIICRRRTHAKEKKTNARAKCDSEQVPETGAQTRCVLLEKSSDGFFTRFLLHFTRFYYILLGFTTMHTRFYQMPAQKGNTHRNSHRSCPQHMSPWALAGVTDAIVYHLGGWVGGLWDPYTEHK